MKKEMLILCANNYLFLHEEIHLRESGHIASPRISSCPEGGSALSLVILPRHHSSYKKSSGTLEIRD